MIVCSLTFEPILGTVVLRMGTILQRDLLSSTLFGRVRRDVLALFFRRPEESFYLRQVVRAVGAGSGAVQREIKRLADAGILSRRGAGHHTYYQANPACPIYAELQGLITKTSGVAGVLEAALAPLSDHIDFAFIHGSVARLEHRSDSDVDVVVIGDVTFFAVIEALAAAQDRLAREVNPTVYSLVEFSKKVDSGHPFVTSVLKGPKIMLCGDERELARLAQ
jgi:predicted nucleotidyltransferase